jgi:hypothetical protein
MTEQQILDERRYQLGFFYLALPSLNGLVAWKPGFPELLAGTPYFFWVQESGDVDLETQVFGTNTKWNLFKVEIGEFGPTAGPNIIGEACDFLPTAEQSTASVLYVPEEFEYQTVGTLNPLSPLPSFEERPEIPLYLDPPGLTYAYTDDSVALFEGDFELVDRQ